MVCDHLVHLHWTPPWDVRHGVRCAKFPGHPTLQTLRLSGNQLTSVIGPRWKGDGWGNSRGFTILLRFCMSIVRTSSEYLSPISRMGKTCDGLKVFHVSNQQEFPRFPHETWGSKTWLFHTSIQEIRWFHQNL